MDILAIGNSFSVDAMYYLHAIARSAGVDMTAAGLYYSGCSLERHFRYMLAGGKSYELQYNGELTGFFVSMKEALLSREWDVITLQQASGYSAQADSYYPYINSLYDFVKQHAPKAKILIHQTWAYEQGSLKLERAGYSDHRDMFRDIEKAYALAAEKVGADGIIASGKMFQHLLANGFEKVHRDTFHASMGAGCYALGLLWFRVLTGQSVMDNAFCDFDEPVTQEEMNIIKTYVEQIAPVL